MTGPRCFAVVIEYCSSDLRCVLIIGESQMVPGQSAQETEEKSMTQDTGRQPHQYKGELHGGDESGEEGERVDKASVASTCNLLAP